MIQAHCVLLPGRCPPPATELAASVVQEEWGYRVGEPDGHLWEPLLFSITLVWIRGAVNRDGWGEGSTLMGA